MSIIALEMSQLLPTMFEKEMQLEIVIDLAIWIQV